MLKLCGRIKYIFLIDRPLTMEIPRESLKSNLLDCGDIPLVFVFSHTKPSENTADRSTKTILTVSIVFAVAAWSVAPFLCQAHEFVRLGRSDGSYACCDLH